MPRVSCTLIVRNEVANLARTTYAGYYAALAAMVYILALRCLRGVGACVTKLPFDNPLG
jgi:hypothetical protein